MRGVGERLWGAIRPARGGPGSGNRRERNAIASGAWPWGLLMWSLDSVPWAIGSYQMLYVVPKDSETENEVMRSGLWQEDGWEEGNLGGCCPDLGQVVQ